MTKCRQCSAEVSDGVRYCPTCQSDLGAPNCRECGHPDERARLADRAREAREGAARRGCEEVCGAFEESVKCDSCVVVTMPAVFAMQFCDDPGTVYSSYETLVGSGLRRPAASEDDRRRAAVGGALFGSYAAKIRYGVLSLTEEGLATYGDVYCRLKPIAIMDRVSFLEKNSYVFVQERPGALMSGMPLGHRAVWENRHELAVAKLAEALAPGQGVADWQALLVRSDGKNRAEDDFIEAHIFDGFDVQAVEAMQMAPGALLSRQQGIDARLALASFEERRGGVEEGA